MKYTEFIKGNEGFKYSINIQYDLGNENKIAGYIPTVSSISMIKNYLNNIMLKEADRATILVGPYGKGKSHLLLILLAIMCSEESEVLNDLVNKIKSIDRNCGDMSEDVLKNKKYLPVILNFNSEDLTQSLLMGIRDALKNNNKEDILPKTYFEVAVDIIKGWEEYPTTYKRVKKILKDNSIKINDFIKELGLYNKECYQIFKEIFKEITSGVEFNPFINTDVVKLIDETNYKLKEQYGYDGIIIVFDEFSKFIEASKEINNSKDLKMLQDLAELSDRSNSPQLHLVCITHKTINEYIKQLPQEKINAWRAIEGRFKELFFDTSSSQNYELISNAILKDNNLFNNYLEEHKLELDELTMEQERLYSDIYSDKEYYAQIVKGCFPLSPYTTYALPIISEMVAQNERTLFTYLSKDEPYSLMNLIKRYTKLKLIQLDSLYDYFSNLFKKETFNEKVYDIWLKVDIALKIVDDTLQKRILKILGIIYLIDDFKNISPNEYNLKNILNIKEKELNKKLENMIEAGILLYRESSETLDFMPISHVNVQNDISNIAETRFNNPLISKDLSEIISLKFVLPKRYNDEYKITRFFKRKFITIEELIAYENSSQIIEKFNTDGIILDLIYFNEEDIEVAKEWLNKINDNRVILVIPDNKFGLKKDLSKYEAISYLSSNIEYLKKDTGIESQLEVISEDLIAKISKDININYEIQSEKCKVYINKNIYKNLKANKFSSYLSDICDKNYKLTPIVNNELINKNTISTPVKKARDLIISLLLENKYDDFDYSKNALECTLFRATLINTKVLSNELSEESNIYSFIDKIKEFCIKAENDDISFNDLYNDLTTNKEKIGARKGIIPIYLSLVFKDYDNEIIVYLKSGRTKKEVNLDVSTLNNINDNPKNYLMKIEKGTEEKREYIDNIKSMFENYIKPNNSINIYENIVFGMKAWFNSLCLYTKNHKINIRTGNSIDKGIIKFRNEIVKFDLNYRKFIYDDLLRIFEVDSYSECIEKLIKMKKALEVHIDEVRLYLSEEIVNIFNETYKGSPINALRNWFNNLNKDKKTYIFDGNTKELIDLVKEMDNNSIIVIDRICNIYTNLSVEDFNDVNVNILLDGLKESKRIVEELELSIDKENNGQIKIILKDDRNNDVERVFDKEPISNIGEMLLNSLEEAIDSFADSIDNNEKRNVLMNILERYI